VERAKSASRPNPVVLSVVVLMLASVLIGSLSCGGSESGLSQQAGPTSDPETSPASEAAPSETTPPSSETNNSGTATSTAETEYASSETATAGSETATPTGEPTDYLGMSSGGSMECHTFYPDGTVELFYGGSSTPTDRGVYQGGEGGGEIAWESGRVSSVVIQSGSVAINGQEVSLIDTCTP